MSNKFSTELLNSQNLKQHLKNMHSKPKVNPLTKSSKKISPHDAQSPLKNSGQTQTNASSNTKPSNIQRKRKLSIKQNKNSDFLGFQNFDSNEQFLQLYNQDPIFRYKVQFLMTQTQKNLKKNPSINILKRKTQTNSQAKQDQFLPQQSTIRTTLKSKRSLNDMILMQHCSSYKEMIQKCNSQNQTCYTSKHA